jgi:signal transduction histidine kinase
MSGIEGDWDRLKRTCINLIENAISHSPEYGEVVICTRPVAVKGQLSWGEATGDFHLKLPQSGDTFVSITVTDQGIGIPKEYHEAVFEKFFTIDGSNDRGVKNLGLGLTFCRQVVEAHGGAIWLKSPVFMDETSQNKGCRFELILPLGPR